MASPSLYILQLYDQAGRPAGGLAIIPPGSPDGPTKWVFAGSSNPLSSSRGTPQGVGAYATYLLDPNGVAVATLTGFDLSNMPKGARGSMSLPTGPLNAYNWLILDTDVGASAYNACRKFGLPTHPLLAAFV